MFELKYSNIDEKYLIVHYNVLYTLLHCTLYCTVHCTVLYYTVYFTLQSAILYCTLFTSIFVLFSINPDVNIDQLSVEFDENLINFVTLAQQFPLFDFKFQISSVIIIS